MEANAWECDDCGEVSAPEFYVIPTLYNEEVFLKWRV